MVKKFAPYNSPIRLYNKKTAGFNSSSVHDSVIPRSSDVSVVLFNSPVLHRSFRSLKHAVEKINAYTTLQARDMVEKNKPMPYSIRIIFEPLLMFVKAYFFRKYFLLGLDGFVESFMYAFAKTLRLVKVRELWKEKKLAKLT